MAGHQVFGVQATDALAKAAASLAEDADAPASHIDRVAASLTDSRPGVRLAAARTMGQAGDRAAPHAAEVARLLNESDAQALRKAESSLLNMGQPGASALDACLSDPREYVRINAVMTLGKMGSIGAAVLANHLADDDPNVRNGAARELAQQRKVGGEALCRSMKSPEPLIRANAARCLGWMGASGGELAFASHAYIPELLNLVDDEAGKGDVRASAVEAMSKMGRNGGKALASRLADEVPAVRRAVASALLAMDDDGVEVLKACLRDPSPGIRRHALDLLATLGPVGAKALARCLDTDPDAGVRRRAAEGLGKMGSAVDESHVQVLAAKLEDRDHWVQVAAARSLGQLGVSAGTQEAAAGLLAPFASNLGGRLRAEKRLVRLSAAKALGRAGAEVAKPQAQALANYLGHSDLDVRTKAADALAEMGDVGTIGSAIAKDWLRNSGEETRARSRAALDRSELLQGSLIDVAYGSE